MQAPGHPASGGPNPLQAPIASIGDVERFVLALVRHDPRPYAERAGASLRNMRELLAALGHPEQGLRFAHIAGSKGKGSVALMLEALMRAAGTRIGTYTSPHLVAWNDRFRVDGQPVDDAVLIRAIAAVQPAVNALRAAAQDGPSFFDALTAAALWLFRDAGCDTAILECGLGGRHDATNVVVPAVTCVTGIELEHTDKLGASLEAIAWHKAGIAKPGVPLVVPALAAQARAAIDAVATEVGAPVVHPGRDYALDIGPAECGRRAVRLRDGDATFTFAVGHPAAHMAANAALAVLLARRLGVACPATGVLATVALPGRAQVVRRRPLILVDGAHTAASLEALGERIAGVPARDRRFLVSATTGKDPSALAQLLAGAARVVVTEADPLRSMRSAELAERLRAAGLGAPVVLEPDPSRALELALSSLEAHELLCVCGSVYLAGFALRSLER